METENKHASARLDKNTVTPGRSIRRDVVGMKPEMCASGKYSPDGALKSIDYVMQIIKRVRIT